MNQSLQFIKLEQSCFLQLFEETRDKKVITFEQVGDLQFQCPCHNHNLRKRQVDKSYIDLE